MKNKYLVIMILLLLIIPFSYSIPTPPTSYVIGIKITSNGKGVENATIIIKNTRTEDKLEGLTVKDGTYIGNLANMPSYYKEGDSIEVSYSYKKTYADSKTIIVSKEKPGNIINFELKRIETTSLIIIRFIMLLLGTFFGVLGLNFVLRYRKSFKKILGVFLFCIGLILWTITILYWRGWIKL